MNNPLDKLISLLDLARLDDVTFQGDSYDIGTNRVYGGQVLGQALKAAQTTVDATKSVHSMHAYFLRLGDHNLPITYKVDITRDGRSFSTRRVVASQNNTAIFITALSFQIQEPGLEFQTSMPDIVTPESLKSINDLDTTNLDRLPEALHRLYRLSAPFDIRPVTPAQEHVQSGGEYQRLVWLKTIHALNDDPNIHRAILAYISDYGLVTSALIPHDLTFSDPTLQLASIDHGMWFHRPFRADEWLLYRCDAINTSNARGLARGSFYSRDGHLIATTIQEGLLRKIEKK